MVEIDLRDSTALILSIMALIGPAIIAAINRPTWTDQTRRIVSILVAMFLAVLGLALTGGFTNNSTVLVAITGVIGLTKVIYDLLYKPTGLSNTIESHTGGVQAVEADYTPPQARPYNGPPPVV